MTNPAYDTAKLVAATFVAGAALYVGREIWNWREEIFYFFTEGLPGLVKEEAQTLVQEEENPEYQARIRALEEALNGGMFQSAKRKSDEARKGAEKAYQDSKTLRTSLREVVETDKAAAAEFANTLAGAKTAEEPGHFQRANALTKTARAALIETSRKNAEKMAASEINAKAVASEVEAAIQASNDAMRLLPKSVIEGAIPALKRNPRISALLPKSLADPSQLQQAFEPVQPKNSTADLSEAEDELVAAHNKIRRFLHSGEM